MRKTSDILWQDAQHQVLFEILELIKAPGSGSRVFSKLRDYTENHFAVEEHYMRVMEYPRLEEHVRAHDTFREEVEQLLAGEEEPDDIFREVVATFLTEWLLRHVFGIDKELEAFILDSDLK
jgi:hemerythrin